MLKSRSRQDVKFGLAVLSSRNRFDIRGSVASVNGVVCR